MRAEWRGGQGSVLRAISQCTTYPLHRKEAPQKGISISCRGQPHECSMLLVIAAVAADVVLAEEPLPHGETRSPSRPLPLLGPCVERLKKSRTRSRNSGRAISTCST